MGLIDKIPFGKKAISDWVYKAQAILEDHALGFFLEPRCTCCCAAAYSLDS
jgi:hypothetical protein